jgi:hypothetical protein
MTKAPFTCQSERASDLMGLTDICGPIGSIAKGGFQNFVTFTDDFSRYSKVFVDHNGVFLEKEFLSKGISGSKVST